MVAGLGSAAVSSLDDALETVIENYPKKDFVGGQLLHRLDSSLAELVLLNAKVSSSDPARTIVSLHDPSCLDMACLLKPCFRD